MNGGFRLMGLYRKFLFATLIALAFYSSFADGNRIELAHHLAANVQTITDRRGNATTYFYDERGYVLSEMNAFGEIDSQSGATDNAYRFTAEQFEPLLDQYYLRDRYMDPAVGRFTRMDAFQGMQNNPVTLHKYLYANGNPAYFVDPTGRFGLAEVNVSISVASAFTSGYSIGSGVWKISEGNYTSGFVDIGLGFMGAGVLTKAPFAISSASKMLAGHRGQYISLVTGMGDDVLKLQNQGKTLKEVAEWAVKRRNEIKVLIRNKMLADAVTPTEKALAKGALYYAEIRNSILYGNKVGPTLSYYISKNKRLEDVIAGAQRASDDVTRFFGTTGWGLLP